MFCIAYPHFNPREELSAVHELFTSAVEPQGQRSLLIFNGELDRLRGALAAL